MFRSVSSLSSNSWKESKLLNIPLSLAADTLTTAAHPSSIIYFHVVMTDKRVLLAAFCSPFKNSLCRPHESNMSGVQRGWRPLSLGADESEGNSTCLHVCERTCPKNRLALLAALLHVYVLIFQVSPRLHTLLPSVCAHCL